MDDRTALSYWFPKLVAAGLPVPETRLFSMPPEAERDIWNLFDGKSTDNGISAFIWQLSAVATDMGFPIFLRTDHTSGKHEWNKTCYVTKAEDIAEHITNIAYFSECSAMFGELPWDTWALREYLPIKPFGVCPAYHGMPICREFRFFVEDANIICRHPYWPAMAIERGGARGIDYQALCAIPDETVHALAARAGEAVGGAWSVDILETERGWFITDMAEAYKSWHWPECPVVANATG